MLDGERVRAVHPLLAAAAKRHATADERRDLHRALADVVANEHRRAFHLALATPTEDEHLAVRVAAAADAAQRAARPCWRSSCATHALRLTPTDSPAYVARCSTSASTSGRRREAAPHRAARRAGRVAADPALAVEAYLLLIQGVVRDNDDIRQFLEQALAEAGDDRHLRAPVLAELAENEAAITVAQIARAEERAVEAVDSLGQDRPDDLAAPSLRSPGRGHSADNRSTTWPRGTEPSPTTASGSPDTPSASPVSAWCGGERCGRHESC